MGQIIAAIDHSWNDARHQLQTLRTSQAQQALPDSKEQTRTSAFSPRSSALAEEPHHMESLVCLSSPLHSLLAQMFPLQRELAPGRPRDLVDSPYIMLPPVQSSNAAVVVEWPEDRRCVLVEEEPSDSMVLFPLKSRFN